MRKAVPGIWPLGPSKGLLEGATHWMPDVEPQVEVGWPLLLGDPPVSEPQSSQPQN